MLLKEAVQLIIKKTKAMYFDHGAAAQVEEFCRKYKFNLHGQRGFTVMNLSVMEFGYLLKLVTDCRIKNFENLDAIHAEWQAIQAEIGKELQSPVLTEQRALGIAHATAFGNMRNLLTICRIVTEYVELRNRLGAERLKYIGNI